MNTPKIKNVDLEQVFEKSRPTAEHNSRLSPEAEWLQNFLVETLTELQRDLPPYRHIHNGEKMDLSRGLLPDRRLQGAISAWAARAKSTTEDPLSQDAIEKAIAAFLVESINNASLAGRLRDILVNPEPHNELKQWNARFQAVIDDAVAPLRQRHKTVGKFRLAALLDLLDPEDAARAFLLQLDDGDELWREAKASVKYAADKAAKKQREKQERAAKYVARVRELLAKMDLARVEDYKLLRQNIFGGPSNSVVEEYLDDHGVDRKAIRTLLNLAAHPRDIADLITGHRDEYRELEQAARCLGLDAIADLAELHDAVTGHVGFDVRKKYLDIVDKVNAAGGLGEILPEVPEQLIDPPRALKPEPEPEADNTPEPEPDNVYDGPGVRLVTGSSSEIQAVEPETDEPDPAPAADSAGERPPLG